MSSPVWLKAVRGAADPVRAEHYLRLLEGTAAKDPLTHATPEEARVLAGLFSGSQALSELLLHRPDWISLILDPGRLKYPRQHQGLRREVRGLVARRLGTQDLNGALAEVRLFKQRELLRIAARDLAGLGPVAEITRELSDVADVCLEAFFDVTWRRMVERVGQPWHMGPGGEWQQASLCLLGLGKLGGQELNYSSDVDVLFVYSGEGAVFKEPPRRNQPAGNQLSTHRFCQRVAEDFLAEVRRLAPDGALYRIDVRLRPEGNTGPLARSLESYEDFYAQWGQIWERMMLIKARPVAGDRDLGGEFLEAIQPFRYPRSLGDQALAEIAAMKRRIENEVVKAGEMERNVKLGRGGIRELEFVAQTLQILHVDRLPFLADTQTVPTLRKLVRYSLLPAGDVERLVAAYEFLRNIEHRLQMENSLQTHSLPTDRKALQRLAALMGCKLLAMFQARLSAHRSVVRRVYDGLMAGGRENPGRSLPPDFAGYEPSWIELFRRKGFRDPTKALKLITTFVCGPGFGHVSGRTLDLARGLVARVLDLCPPFPTTPAPRATGHRGLSDPDRVLARLDSFVAAYGARALLFETWASNPSLFDLLVLLFDRSEFLAETAIRTPDMVDELEQSGQLRRSKTTAQILADLRHGTGDADQRLWVRKYHQTELMRIGLRDILGLADFEQNLVELSALAEACLQYGLEVVLRQRRFKGQPLAIIGLGKLGGAELNYGSDLDVVFIADDKAKNLAKLQRVAVDLIELLSAPTEFGVAFVMDVRLRPDGEQGLLVNSLESYRNYYLERAQLWELQAISRTRPVAGNADLGARFQQAVAALTDFHLPERPAAARNPAWRREIARMRLRIEQGRTQPGGDVLAIKTGVGGLIDAEFVAQTFCLEQGWQEPNTLRALQLAAERGVFAGPLAEGLIANYRQLRRVEGILRRWSYAGETTLPEDPAALYRVAVRCGFHTGEDLLAAVVEHRRRIRQAYLAVLGPGKQSR